MLEYVETRRRHTDIGGLEEYTDMDACRNGETKKKKNDIEWSRIGGMYPMGYKRGRIVPGGVLLWPMSWAQRSQIHDMTGNVHRN